MDARVTRESGKRARAGSPFPIACGTADPEPPPGPQTRIAGTENFLLLGAMVSRLRPVRILRIVTLVCSAALGALPLPLTAGPRGEFSAHDRDIIEQRWPEAGQTASGMRYVILKEGEGPKARTRQRVSVLYSGSFLDGTIFSQKLDPEKPFTFTLGNGDVIQGWEEALLDMRAGEKRLLVIPYALGYGLRGREPDIPNRATLVFEVEVLKIE